MNLYKLISIFMVVSTLTTQTIAQSNSDINPLFKTEKGKKEILKLYDEKLDQLQINYESEIVKTSFGSTHVIICGEESGPPMVLVHGSNGNAPIALETYPELGKKYRLYVVDVLAQPNKSAGTRLSMKDDSYGKWMNELIDTLNIDSVTMAGFSFGGLIILKTLEFDETKIKEVFMAAPAYIVNGNPLKSLFNVFIPMKKYMKTEESKYVEKFLTEVFTDRDEFAIKYLSKVFLEFDMDFTPVPVIKKKRAQSIKTPITLFAAKEDVMFPGKKMTKRAAKIFPSLKKTILMEDSKHVQNKDQNKMIQKTIME